MHPILLQITRLPVGRRASGFVQVAKGLATAERRFERTTSAFRAASWWAQLVGALQLHPVNIELTIPKNQIEELMNVRGVGEKSFLKLKPLITVVPPKADRVAQE
jgi:hypothetical protein